MTIFVGQHELPVQAPNGSNWLLRAYPTLQGLTALEPQGGFSSPKAFPLRALAVQDDYPSWDDAAGLCPEELADEYEDLFPTLEGLKVGGWPFLVQSELDWSFEPSSNAPRYALQIDSNEKAQWQWGHGGVGYFGRRPSHAGPDEWAMTWQTL